MATQKSTFTMQTRKGRRVEERVIIINFEKIRKDPVENQYFQKNFESNIQ